MVKWSQNGKNVKPGREKIYAGGKMVKPTSELKAQHF